MKLKTNPDRHQHEDQVAIITVWGILFSIITYFVNIKRSMIIMPHTFQRRFTFQIDSPTNNNIIIIWMWFISCSTPYTSFIYFS